VEDEEAQGVPDIEALLDVDGVKKDAVVEGEREVVPDTPSVEVPW
jgi:hypothetical protein